MSLSSSTKTWTSKNLAKSRSFEQSKAEICIRALCHINKQHLPNKTLQYQQPKTYRRQKLPIIISNNFIVFFLGGGKSYFEASTSFSAPFQETQPVSLLDAWSWHSVGSTEASTLNHWTHIINQVTSWLQADCCQQKTIGLLWLIIYIYMGVSKNRGTPKSMAYKSYNGKPY